MPEGRTAADYTLLIALFGSVAVRLSIVTSDVYLWAVAPTHAYGLLAFVGIDVALISGLSLPSGISAGGFSSYLLSDVSFVVLMSLQPAIAYLGGMALAEERRRYASALGAGPIR